MLSGMLIASFFQAIDYAVERDGRVLGKAKVFVRISKDGKLRTDTKLNLGRLEMITGEIRLPDGTPEEKSQIVKADGETKVKLIVKFRERAAWIDDQPIKPEPGADVRIPSQFWFLKDLPEVGATERAYDFDVDAKSWVWQEVKYIGHETKALGGKRVESEHLKYTNAKRTMDVWKSGSGQVLISKSSDGITIVRADLR